MQRYFFIYMLLASALLANANVRVSQGTAIELDDPKGFQHVFVFDQLTSAEIMYVGTDSDIKWYKTTDTIHAVATGVDYISPENATGYLVKTNTERFSFFVFDYSQYYPVFTSFAYDLNYDKPCEYVFLQLVSSVPLMQYESFVTGQMVTLNREFKLKYATKEWNSSELKWNDKDLEYVLPADFQEGLYEAPLCDTKFVISGDQFAQQLGITPFQIETLPYTALRVQCNVSSIAELRNAQNEIARPTESSLEGSAPLNIFFNANANEPVAEYFEWKVFRADELLIQRSDRELRHTFDEAGEYFVNLKVSNGAGCIDTASITVKVFESLLEVPNVFTPNGDGKNDEFKVVYSSILEFQCWIYNRWGRKVYYWSDPAQGWDGTINGKPAAPGPYFYSIKALGSDEKEYKLKGDINLIGR